MQGEEGEARKNGQDGGGRPERIGIGGGDDSMARIQLAARWSEAYAPEGGDSLGSILKRFRLAYEYLDAVIHGVEPNEPEPELADSKPTAQAAPQQAPTNPPSYTPPTYSSPPAETPPAPPQPEPESRPWG